jgi:tetratricopeptide (TPR) repeat protein
MSTKKKRTAVTGEKKSRQSASKTDVVSKRESKNVSSKRLADAKLLEELQQALKSSQKFEEDGLFVEAAAVLQTYFEANPKGNQIRYSIGSVLAADGRYKEATNFFIDQLQTLGAYYKVNLSVVGKDAARKVAIQLSTTAMESVLMSLLELSLCFKATDKEAKAEALQTQMLDFMGSQVDQWWQTMSTSYYNACKHKLALHCMMQVLNNQPPALLSPMLLLKVTFFARLAGQFEKAHSLTARALKAASLSGDATFVSYAMVVFAWQSLETSVERTAALVKVEAVLSTEDRNSSFANASAWMLYAMLAIFNGDLVLALPCFRASFAYLNPDTTMNVYGHHALLHRACLLSFLDEKARDAALMSSDPHAVPARLRPSDFAVCVAFYSELLCRYGPDARLYWYRANSYRCLGRVAAYVDDLQRVQILNPLFLSEYMKQNGDARVPHTATWLQWPLVLTLLSAHKQVPLEASIHAAHSAELKLVLHYYNVVAARLCASEDAAHVAAVRGDLQRQLGAWPEATRSYLQALQLRRGCLLARVGLAQAQMREFGLTRAETLCVQALRALLHAHDHPAPNTNLNSPYPSPWLHAPSLSTLPSSPSPSSDLNSTKNSSSTSAKPVAVGSVLGLSGSDIITSIEDVLSMDEPGPKLIPAKLSDPTNPATSVAEVLALVQPLLKLDLPKLQSSGSLERNRADFLLAARTLLATRKQPRQGGDEGGFPGHDHEQWLGDAHMLLRDQWTLAWLHIWRSRRWGAQLLGLLAQSALLRGRLGDLQAYVATAQQLDPMCFAAALPAGLSNWLYSHTSNACMTLARAVENNPLWVAGGDISRLPLIHAPFVSNGVDRIYLFISPSISFSRCALETQPKARMLLSHASPHRPCAAGRCVYGSASRE